MYFWEELFYLAALPLTKISILLFYLKIFPKRGIKIAVWILVGFNVGYLIAFEVISIWQCTPIPGAWLEWDGTYTATCRDINMQGWVCFCIQIRRGRPASIAAFELVYDRSSWLVAEDY